jgi:hypothetical protein
MSLWQPEDWDAHVTADVRERVRTLREAGGAEPVVLLVSPASAAGVALLAQLGETGFGPGDRTPLLVTRGDCLGRLLDRHVGAGVGGVVLGVPLAADACRGVLVLPETVEVHAVRLEATRGNVWPVCVLDLAARRLHASDDGGQTWHSSDLTP